MKTHFQSQMLHFHGFVNTHQYSVSAVSADGNAVFTLAPPKGVLIINFDRVVKVLVNEQFVSLYLTDSPHPSRLLTPYNLDFLEFFCPSLLTAEFREAVERFRGRIEGKESFTPPLTADFDVDVSGESVKTTLTDANGKNISVKTTLEFNKSPD